MKLKPVAKTDLICLFCRKKFAELHNQLCFPIAFDFCIDCEKKANLSFARQIDGERKLLPKGK